MPDYIKVSRHETRRCSERVAMVLVSRGACVSRHLKLRVAQRALVPRLPLMPHLNHHRFLQPRRSEEAVS